MDETDGKKGENFASNDLGLLVQTYPKWEDHPSNRTQEKKEKEEKIQNEINLIHIYI